MSSGLAWDENRPWNDPRNNEAGMIMAADPFRYILSQPVAWPPGTVYAYSGGGTSLLGETLVKSTGQSLRDYARDKLFTPLDITDFEWLDAGVSRKLGAFGSLRLRPRDAAKLGRLLLTDGQWNGRQVLPSGWAAEIDQAAHQRRGAVLLRLSMVARPLLPQRCRTHLDGRRRPGRSAPVHRAVARPCGHDQLWPLRQRAAGGHSCRHLQSHRAAGGEGLKQKPPKLIPQLLPFAPLPSGSVHDRSSR